MRSLWLFSLPFRDRKMTNSSYLSRAYLGRVESKYERIEQGQNVDRGHQEQIAGLGNWFRKASGLPAYKQQDPTGKN